MSLHWADYAVFAVFLIISLAIGVYSACSGGRQRSTKEFISGDRRLSVLPTMLSLLVSYQSAILILGMTAEVYRYGIQGSFLHIIAFIIASIIAERLYVPWMYRLKLTSVFEYLQLRYNSLAVRSFGVALGLSFMCLYTGAALFAPATALKAVTGFPIGTTVIIMAVVSAIYTSMGGMKAVVYTDVFQAVTMLAGILAFMIKAILLATQGGDNIWDIARDGGRTEFADFNPDPRERHTFWGFIIGMSWTWSVVFGLTQPSVQRYCALPTLAKARQVVLFNMVPLSIINTLICIAGLAIYAYYVVVQCDPLESGQVTSPNQIVPYFVVTSFQDHPGVTGLFMAALFSGAMSSVSSSLSSAAAVAWQDIFKTYKPDISDAKGTIINKLLVVLFAGIAVGIAFLAASMPSVPLSQTTSTFFGIISGTLSGVFLMGGCLKLANWKTAFTFFGLCAGPLGGIFVMGGRVKFANWKGALAGCFAGTIFTLWLGIGAMTISRTSYSLPPAPTDGCDNSTGTLRSFMSHNSTTGVATTLEKYSQYSGIEHFYTLSYIWYALFGTIVTLLVGIPTSYFTGGADGSEPVNDSLYLTISGLLTSPFATEVVQQSDDNLSCKGNIKQLYHSVKFSQRKNQVSLSEDNCDKPNQTHQNGLPKNPENKPKSGPGCGGEQMDCDMTKV